MENETLNGRSAISSNGMVVSSQPLASKAGIEVLHSGGNAIDATVTMAAVLNVVEPMSTGIGGDAFVLAYFAESREIKGLNASGRSPGSAGIDVFKRRNLSAVPDSGMLPVTVPGALDGWATILESYGTKSLGDLLQPAIHLGRSGFQVGEKTALKWLRHKHKIVPDANAAANYLIEGEAPKAGQTFRQPRLAATFEKIARGGARVFYEGEIAEAVVEYSRNNEGLISLDDLATHRSNWVQPLQTSYRGVTVYEMPPNTQGVTVLQMLNMMEVFEPTALGRETAAYQHLLIEMKKMAFIDRDRHIADPDQERIPLDKLLDKSYAREQSKRIEPDRAALYATNPPMEADTQFFAAVDKTGNAVAFINSLFDPFGSGVVAGDTGILLHNRGKFFSLDPSHPNCVAPRKRPRHTIIPAMAFKDDRPFLVFGVTGGDMQPQGHVQVLANIVDFGMTLQDALDAPRVNHLEGLTIGLERPVNEEVKTELARKGHRLVDHQDFGVGQAIKVDPASGRLEGASDPRQDGCAMGY
jgi:gamma-glutamyltranspeptidase/glutathione hydrolase